MNARRWSWLPAICLLAGTAVAQQPAGGDWTTYGGDLWNRRYSGLNQITTANVGKLVPRRIVPPMSIRPTTTGPARLACLVSLRVARPRPRCRRPRPSESCPCPRARL